MDKWTEKKRAALKMREPVPLFTDSGQFSGLPKRDSGKSMELNHRCAMNMNKLEQAASQTGREPPCFTLQSGRFTLKTTRFTLKTVWFTRESKRLKHESG